jgi:hypothetical protein
MEMVAAVLDAATAMAIVAYTPPPNRPTPTTMAPAPQTQGAFGDRGGNASGHGLTEEPTTVGTEDVLISI